MGRFKALRGVKNVHDMGRVVEFNGDTEMDTWDGDLCNQFKGTDSTIFPPFLTREEGIWAFAPDLCRSLGTEYVGKSRYMGIKLDHFSINFPDLRVKYLNFIFIFTTIIKNHLILRNMKIYNASVVIHQTDVRKFIFLTKTSLFENNFHFCVNSNADPKE